MKLEDFIHLDQMRLTFKYTTVQNEEKEYDHPTTISELSRQNIKISTVALPIEDLPLNNMRDLTIWCTMLDGQVITVGVLFNELPLSVEWFAKDSYLPLAMDMVGYLQAVLATYGWWWFQQNTAFDLSELKDNPMFKKGAEAAQEGMRFHRWFIRFAADLWTIDGVLIDEKTVLERGMSKENWDKIVKDDVVGLPMSLIKQTADALGMSLDVLSKRLTDAGVIKLKDFQGDQNGGIQPQTEVSEDAPGAGDVPNDSVPLEGKPEGR